MQLPVPRKINKSKLFERAGKTTTNFEIQKLNLHLRRSLRQALQRELVYSAICSFNSCKLNCTPTLFNRKSKKFCANINLLHTPSACKINKCFEVGHLKFFLSLASEPAVIIAVIFGDYRHLKRTICYLCATTKCNVTSLCLKYSLLCSNEYLFSVGKT